MLQYTSDDTIPAVAGVEHRFVNIGGLTFHYAEAGMGEPLVLIHGSPQHWYMWRHQIPLLAQKYRVICPDLRGFGWSDAPAAGYEKEQLAADVIALLDALGIREFRLMAHDWGGWIGFLLCLHHPARVRRYLALNIPHPFQKADSRMLAAWRFWYQWLISVPWLGYWLIRTSGLVRTILRLGFSRTVWADEELSIYTARLAQPNRAKATVLLYRTFLLREFIPVILGRYTSLRLLPTTLLLFGIDDFFISPAFLRGYEPFADRMSVELVADCGHFIAEERPELVIRRSLEFFAE